MIFRIPKKSTHQSPPRREHLPQSINQNMIISKATIGFNTRSLVRNTHGQNKSYTNTEKKTMPGKRVMSQHASPRIHIKAKKSINFKLVTPETMVEESEGSQKREET